MIECCGSLSLQGKKNGNGDLTPEETDPCLCIQSRQDETVKVWVVLRRDGDSGRRNSARMDSLDENERRTSVGTRHGSI